MPRRAVEDQALVEKGFFICVEGLDGCGKTTQTKILVNNLKKRVMMPYIPLSLAVEK
jgi:uridine kinase